MLLSKSISFNFRVSYSQNVTEIKLFFKFNIFGNRLFFKVGLPPYESKDVSKKSWFEKESKIAKQKLYVCHINI